MTLYRVGARVKWGVATTFPPPTGPVYLTRTM